MVSGISLPAAAAAAQAQAQAQQAAVANLRVQLAAAIHRDALSIAYRAAAGPSEPPTEFLAYLVHPDRAAGDAVKHADALLAALGIASLPGAAAAGSSKINGSAEV